MVKTVTWDYIDETSFAAETPETARITAEKFLAIARDSHTEYGDDTSPAALYIAAAECFHDASLPRRAYEAAREAQDAEGEVAPDKRVYLLDALLRTNQQPEAQKLADTLGKENTQDPMVYSFVGETYAELHNTEQALDWFDRGIRMMDQLIDDASDLNLNELAQLLEDRELLILGRHAVREDAGLPADKLDEEALEIFAAHEEDDDDLL
ncbi:hypothetical protein [Lysinibacter sp. HNR]|uniref:hypothetical protein n=1 Tax=Lysinibacter sp. HNR TaxID=3031408 RepID=UPI0024358C40|nr:hypothetical protein [Lysinibacter sp. HNR]WGD37636.1 hypothetical protein FrondiHNR_01580 [Lysinibacter sp. HNR]